MHLNDDIYATDIDGTNERLIIADTTGLNPMPNPDEILCKKEAEDGYEHIYKLNITDFSLTQYSFGDFNDDAATVNP